MTYTGRVTVGGPAEVHQLAGLLISKVAVGPMENNAYLLRCRETGEQLLIDAANEPETLLRLIGDDSVASVVTTHRHGDHWQALADVIAATGARTYAGRLDTEGIPVATDVPLDDGDELSVGHCRLVARHLRGHTEGSIALVYDDPRGHPHLFTGDCLFPGGVGSTFGDAEAFRTLLHDVETRFFDVLPDETWVYPGHGADTTLGAERPQLAAWRERGW
ncbi:MBL fold metallo-hydrolase [Streptomyces spiramenti]|uniref:MBL fold metallo-hydrolase n=1 Tax=Streptomyces spiramenti TaxID=2720606 RepID=A0ABX1ANS1_9ACTN|nr:MBL fold metallo-hydrolase [Streptomyces spiramenti]NJP67346.1 MBL fold metallo-hydrolase [Streptomyces spiramenti]